MTENRFYNKLIELVGEMKVKVQELLSKHTTFRIGGEADYFVTPSTVEEVKAVVALCKEEQIPFYIIGNGSNLLFGDGGFRGVVIQLGSSFAEIQMNVEDNADRVIVKAQSGVMLSKLAMTIAREGYAGFEYAAGIPGTLGGAVTMNAGAYGGEIKDHIIEAVVLDEEGNVITLSKEELQLGYRTSIIQKKELIVLEASFSFEKGDTDTILTSIKDLNNRRKEKQPLEYPSAGSTFKRPEGHFAGKLIMDSGLRGYRVGNVCVSEKHCGFVINLGGGTAKDVMTLIEDVKRIVFEKYQVELEPEVRIVGEFR
ncbi:UDP-N-acetylenolpyruvoylglucosamine reductase [Lachnospiraceae bacterium KM106-2]|nr:UDP-N-acetylenolpyruvoylglucosamine reductase [Lachnospiraceae bacterium KM106-2]